VSLLNSANDERLTPLFDIGTCRRGGAALDTVAAIGGVAEATLWRVEATRGEDAAGGGLGARDIVVSKGACTGAETTAFFGSTSAGRTGGETAVGVSTMATRGADVAGAIINGGVTTGL
jgi:hypothetical protein